MEPPLPATRLFANPSLPTIDVTKHDKTIRVGENTTVNLELVYTNMKLTEGAPSKWQIGVSTASDGGYVCCGVGKFASTSSDDGAHISFSLTTASPEIQSLVCDSSRCYVIVVEALMHGCSGDECFMRKKITNIPLKKCEKADGKTVELPVSVNF